MVNTNTEEARLQGAANEFASKSLVDLGRYGVKIEHVKRDTTYGDLGVCFFISIPESSELLLEDNEIAEGKALERYIKEYIIREYIESFVSSDSFFESTKLNPYTGRILMDIMEKHKKDVHVKVKTRPEHWTKEKEIETNMLNLTVLMQTNLNQ